MNAPDINDRFYEGNPAAKCSVCGSFGQLYHFINFEDICPFCVVRLARSQGAAPVIHAMLR